MGSCVWSGVVVVGDPAPASLAARFQSPQLGWGCLSALARWDLQDIPGQGLGSVEHRVLVGAVSRVDQRRNSEALLSMTQAMAVSTGEKMPTLFCPNRPSFYIGVFAEFETNLRRELQMEGIAAAKLKGVYKGRPPSIDAARSPPSKPRAWAPPRSPSAWAWGGRASTGCWRRERRMDDSLASALTFPHVCDGC
jgi:hypothetical protein